MSAGKDPQADLRPLVGWLRKLVAG